MHPNAELITRFYTAFALHDGVTMASCYAPEATFSDPVFPSLRGPQIGAMWRMLCDQGTDLVVRSSQIQADEATGSAHWDADYTLSTTGRFVNNHIDARFTFTDGKIAKHVDNFDLYAWTRMALGPVGLLLGWTPLVQKQVRAQAAKGLRRWLEQHPELA
ncbi:MAG: nuclear transport factor 2 family protein [Oligoflexia bacterium]|nr:nuclear transport factor 2 family protein [Oligoflexia bacterium]